MAWADRSISMQKTFANLRTKAVLLEKKGDAKTAAALRAEAMPLATEADINNLGYQLLGDNKIAEALDMFRKNTKDHPQSWNVWDSLGEGLEKSGDKKGARENYQKALTHGPRGPEKAPQRHDREAEVGRDRPPTACRTRRLMLHRLTLRVLSGLGDREGLAVRRYDDLRRHGHLAGLLPGVRVGVVVDLLG